LISKYGRLRIQPQFEGSLRLIISKPCRRWIARQELPPSQVSNSRPFLKADPLRSQRSWLSQWPDSGDRDEPLARVNFLGDLQDQLSRLIDLSSQILHISNRSGTSSTRNAPDGMLSASSCSAGNDS